MPLDIHPERSVLEEDKPRLIIPALIWLGCIVAIILIMLQLGCAQDRYLTVEQDQEMRSACAPHGCVVIPNPAWDQIEALLKRMGAI